MWLDLQSIMAVAQKQRFCWISLTLSPCWFRCFALQSAHWTWPLQGGYFETRDMLKRGEGRWEGCPDLFGDSPAAEIFP